MSLKNMLAYAKKDRRHSVQKQRNKRIKTAVPTNRKTQGQETQEVGDPF